MLSPGWAGGRSLRVACKSPKKPLIKPFSRPPRRPPPPARHRSRRNPRPAPRCAPSPVPLCPRRASTPTGALRASGSGFRGPAASSDARPPVGGRHDEPRGGVEHEADVTIIVSSLNVLYRTLIDSKRLRGRILRPGTVCRFHWGFRGRGDVRHDDFASCDVTSYDRSSFSMPSRRPLFEISEVEKITLPPRTPCSIERPQSGPLHPITRDYPRLHGPVRPHDLTKSGVHWRYPGINPETITPPRRGLVAGHTLHLDHAGDHAGRATRQETHD